MPNDWDEYAAGWDDDKDVIRYSALVVASSVCSFLPDYENAVGLLASLLAPGGWFVQWDWLPTPTEPGLSEETIRLTQAKAGLEDVSVSVAFSMVMPEGDMAVLKGFGRLP